MHGHQPGQPLSIERPTPWNKGYTLDESLVPVTVGEIGVSWAGSSEVSRGYVDLPEKTAERFRFDPYSQDG
jgi:non-ribosomal peptide synthetase component F